MALTVGLETDETLGGSVARRIDEEHIDTVIVAGCDLNGLLRGKFLPAERFRRTPAAAVPICDAIYLVDLAGNLAETLIPPADRAEWWPVDAGAGDLLFVPDLSTFRSVPWLSGTSMVLCDHHRRDGSPLEVSPRFVLKRCIKQAEARGLVPKMAAELEFFLLHRRNDGRSGSPLPVTARSGAHAVEQDGQTGALLAAIRHHAAEYGLPIECTSFEAAPGQYEINLEYSEPLVAADRAFLYKHAVRELAVRHGLVASFMAKPTCSYGSSGHLHTSLWSPDGENLFWDPDGPYGLSSLAGSFIAGQLATLAELTCLYAPNVNSYKRLVSMSAAPTTLSWGYQNRTTALRVVGDGPDSIRVENRCPGADVNVYLAMAAALAGGIFGIDQGLTLGEAVSGNAYAEPALEPLPTSLEAAVNRFEKSEVAKRFLGDPFVEVYTASRRWEIDQFRSQPTDWEIRRYLEVV